MTVTKPRHSRKDVRQHAEWLEDHGWKWHSLDSRGHSRYIWPKTEELLTLPETPRGTMWLRSNRDDALKIMGVSAPNKYRPKSYVARKADPGTVVTKAHVAWFARIVTDVRDDICQTATLNGNDQLSRVTKAIAAKILLELNGDAALRPVVSRPPGGRTLT